MDIKPLIDNLRADLSRAAEVGDEAVRAAAERLAMALDPAARLTLMDALSQAAAEITTELHGPVVEVRLQGREPIFVVTGASPAAPAPEAARTEEFEEGDATARITFRLPESLKVRAEELASRNGQSLNTWLVNAARMAAAEGEGRHRHHRGPGAPGRNRSTPRRIQGWVK